jgi:hypothetical protein
VLLIKILEERAIVEILKYWFHKRPCLDNGLVLIIENIAPFNLLRLGI